MLNCLMYSVCFFTVYFGLFPMVLVEINPIGRNRRLVSIAAKCLQINGRLLSKRLLIFWIFSLSFIVLMAFV